MMGGHRRTLTDIDRLYGLEPAYGPYARGVDGAVLAGRFGLSAGYAAVADATESAFEVYLPPPPEEVTAKHRDRIEMLLARCYPRDGIVIRGRLAGRTQKDIGIEMGVNQVSVCAREAKAKDRMAVAARLPDYAPEGLRAELEGHGVRPDDAIMATVYYWLPNQSRTGDWFGWSQGKVRSRLIERVVPKLPIGHPIRVVIDEWPGTWPGPGSTDSPPAADEYRGGEVMRLRLEEFLAGVRG